MENNKNNKNEYARLLSLFLAELLRSRRISLARAGEIAEKVIQNINLIDNEHHFLKFVKELTHDFEEIMPFHQKVHRHVGRNQRKEMEHKVQTFAANIMSTDLQLAHAILEEAIKDGCNLGDLCYKFPKFKNFVDNNISK